MRNAIALCLSLMTAAILAVTAGASPAFQDGFITGYLEVTGEGQTEIVSSNIDRWKGFSNTEVLYGKGSIDYFSTGVWNQSAGVSTIDRKIEFPKGLLVNVQHFDSSKVFKGSGVDISNVNVVSSYSGMDRMVISPNATTFDVKSEFSGIWNLEAFRNDINRKIDTKTTLDGKFEINKELIFR
ncbi:hypothetical protein P0O24_12140 [Methanotrichaceae archaeon M04Ac]|jgi:hypothetical protein|uniref:Uncharacterized protein n=1 Tax=Candidatus Methanocrinis alkalitolerans TaxID=3033395 RepID=A0ABT5XHY5_9EURY|nr:hypothetical protein [Candidatus Methanocrinis alkalitolerans]MCR3884369.1 hypothetical protein [Methanothrix sp.]MDF0594329.1 hypothetical protein [Candidatus Methanocrinis alkalitolerans]